MGANHHVRDQLVNLVRDTKDLLQMFLLQNWAGIPWKSRRPKFDVSREQLEFLLERGISVTVIAQILGLSVQRTERRLQGSSSQSLMMNPWTVLLREFGKFFPRTVIVRMTGALLSNCVRVQQVRIRESMRWVNPEGVLLRALMINTVYRRKYKVYACSMACRQQS